MSICKLSVENINGMLQDAPCKGLTTGFKSLDMLINGLQKGNVYLLAARPSMGKTWFALNIIRNNMERSSKSVLYMSLELSMPQVVNRLLLLESGIDLNRVQVHGNVGAWNEIVRGLKSIAERNIIIDDTVGLAVEELRHKLNNQEMLRECGLIVIDYWQLMSGSGESKSRKEELVTACRKLKELANEFQLPILVLSQLHRGVEKRADKRPIISDVPEFNSIEQYVDVVMFLHRDDYYNDTESKGTAEIIVAESKVSPVRAVELCYELERWLFYEPTVIQQKSLIERKSDTMTFDTFYPGNTYKLAVAIAKTIAKVPCERDVPLVFHGECGVGKTHLLSAIEKEIKCLYPRCEVVHMTAQAFVKEIITGNPSFWKNKYCKTRVFIFDNFEFFAGKGFAQKVLYDLFKKCEELAIPIVLAINGDIAEVKFIKRLQNKLRCGFKLEMRMPDYETRLEIANGFAKEISLVLDDEIIQCIAKNRVDAVQIKGQLKYLQRVSEYMSEHRRIMKKITKEGELCCED